MIFDDDKDILQLSTAIFNKNGYDVETWEHCNQMIETVERYQPDVIIFDHQMPGINGADAIRQLKSNNIYKNIPVIYFSSVNEIAEMARQIKANAYLQKPADTGSLLSVVNKLIG